MKLEFHDYPGQAQITFGTLKTFDITMDTMPDKRMRTIRVWLPESYDGLRRFPVLYLHDGQNLFAGLDDRWKWFVEREMKKVPEDAQVIIVAIDTARTRGEELCPAWPLSDRMKNGPHPVAVPLGDRYRDFVIHTLKPLIDENFMTRPEKEFTGVGGSSMGGIQSYYMHTSRPDVFGRSLCFSIAFGVSDLEFILEQFDKVSGEMKDDRMYIYTGGQTVDTTIIPGSVALYRRMENAGMDYQHVCLMIDSREPHFESAWQKYFADGVRYLFSPDNSVMFPPAPPKKGHIDTKI